MTFEMAKVRKPLLDVSGVIDKGDIVVFDGNGSLILPGTCPGAAFVRKAAAGVQGRIPLQAKKKEYLSCERATGGFQSAGSPFKGQNTRPSRPGPPVESKSVGNIHQIEHFNPRGGDRVGACGSARSAKRVDKGNGRRRWREKFLKETPTMSNPSATVRLEEHDTEAARQIRLPERFKATC